MKKSKKPSKQCTRLPARRGASYALNPKLKCAHCGKPILFLYRGKYNPSSNKFTFLCPKCMSEHTFTLVLDDMIKHAFKCGLAARSLEMWNLLSPSHTDASGLQIDG